MRDDIRLDASATLYRICDVAYSIDLDVAAEILGSATRGRARPVRFDARALEIRNPPLVVSLGEVNLPLDGEVRTTTLSAHVFDFGVCSLQIQVRAPESITWAAFVEFASSLDASSDPAQLFERELQALFVRLHPALDRPAIAPLVEEYKIYRMDRLIGIPTDMPVATLVSDAALLPLLLSERRAVSAAVVHELVPHRFSYYEDDLAVLSWESALVVEPRPDDRDVEYVLEFANAQLLELRLHDQQLDAELPLLYDRVAAAKRHLRPTARFRRVLSDLQTRVADITETVERVENALKVTNDVYLARIYSAALDLFREQEWRRGIGRKLRILHDTYAMLNTEAQAGRTELLELVVVLLIFAELALGLLGRAR
jgi:hypothetical protein